MYAIMGRPRMQASKERKIMNKTRNIVTGVLLLIASMLGVYGCGGAEPTPTPIPPTATPAPPSPTPVPPTPTVPLAAATPGSQGAVKTGPAFDLLNKAQ